MRTSKLMAHRAHQTYRQAKKKTREKLKCFYQKPLTRIAHNFSLKRNFQKHTHTHTQNRNLCYFVLKMAKCWPFDMRRAKFNVRFEKNEKKILFPYDKREDFFFICLLKKICNIWLTNSHTTKHFKHLKRSNAFILSHFVCETYSQSENIFVEQVCRL